MFQGKKTSELPNDGEEPAPEDLIGFVDVSSGRTEHTTMDRFGASPAFSKRKVPAGGTTGQGLTKVSDGDFHLEWSNLPGFNYEQDESAGAPENAKERETWFALDTGSCYVYSGGMWVQFASSTLPLPDNPTLNGVTRINGDLIVERPGLTSRIYLESDTASYIIFADNDANTVAYIDVVTATGQFIIRKGDGTAFFLYDPTSRMVTFPDGGVPATEITLQDAAGRFTATNVEDGLQEVVTPTSPSLPVRNVRALTAAEYASLPIPRDPETIFFVVGA